MSQVIFFVKRNSINMKKVLIINGHPNPSSYNYALADAYEKGVITAKGTVARLNIAALSFDPNLGKGYRHKQDLEPDLVAAIAAIKEADHLVWIFPLWWYGYPAIMKGFIDRVFLPGIAFQYEPARLIPQKLLKGKSARIIITADTPKWYYRFFMKSPATQQLKKGTLNFCGIRPVRTTMITPIRNSSANFRQKYLKKIEKLGTTIT